MLNSRATIDRMNSRRRFLKIGAAGCAAPFAILPEPKAAKGTRVDAGPPVKPPDYWDDFPNYMAARVNDVRAKRKAELARITDPEAAKKRQAFVRAKVWELIGGKVEKNPLNAMVTGTIERSAYRIEKLVFESQPKFYVPAHLYLPKSGRQPFPAVLSPLGHAPNGKFYRSYQIVFQNLARQGFAVLAWDPPGQGERFQYLNKHTGESLYGPTGEHDEFGWPALLIGSTTTQFELMDGVRALDYLLSRPEIDAARIGCCGHSGGGTQTMYLCALEPRIAAAVVVEGHTENLAGANYEPPGAFADSEQNIIGGLRAGVDRGDLLAAFAPRPLRICYTVNDLGTTYSPHYIAGNQEIFEELKSLYGLWGAGEKVSLFSSTLPHDYDFFHRRATYEWFHKWLQNGKPAPDEADFDEASEPSLQCTSTGQILTSIGGRSAWQVNRDRLSSFTGERPSGSNRERVRAALTELLGISLPATPSGQTLSSQLQEDLRIERVEFESEPLIRIPGWFIKPANAPGKVPVVVMVQDQGCDSIFDEFTFLQRLVRRGHAVCSVDLRTVGITTPNFPKSGPLFYHGEEPIAYPLVNLWNGAPIVGQQSRDVLACLRFLESRHDVDSDRIALSARGNVAIAGMFAAALDDRLCGLLVERSLLDFRSIVEVETYKLPLSFFVFGLLKKLDLPDILETFAPRPLLVANPVDAAGESVSLDGIRTRCASIERAYKSANQLSKFSFIAQPEPIDQLLSAWLEKVLG
jgi:cephalosporin-C deacetylase-like acetyl esterase